MATPSGSVGARPLGARWGWGRTEVVVEDAVGGVELEGAGEVAEGVGELAEGPEADPAAPVEGGVVVVDLGRRGGRRGFMVARGSIIVGTKERTGGVDRLGLAVAVMTGH